MYLGPKSYHAKYVVITEVVEVAYWLYGKNVNSHLPYMILKFF